MNTQTIFISESSLLALPSVSKDCSLSFGISHRASLLLLSQIPLGVSKGQWQSDLLKWYYQVNSCTANNIDLE